MFVTVALQITPLPGAWAQKPGSATFPFFGVQVFDTFVFFILSSSVSKSHSCVLLRICRPVTVDEKGVEIEGELQRVLVHERLVAGCIQNSLQ